MFHHNFGKCEPIYKIPSSADFGGNVWCHWHWYCEIHDHVM